MLRWHEVNGTYPARTIKATLYDNEEGGLVGSGQYSAAGTAATLLQEPTDDGCDRSIHVASTTNLGVGSTSRSTSRRPHRERGRQTAGTAARGATTLAAASAAGDTNVKVTGQSTTSSAATAVGATNIKFASATNILANTQLTIGTGASAETVDDHERRRHGRGRQRPDGHARARDRPPERFAHPHLGRVRRRRAGQDRGADRRERGVGHGAVDRLGRAPPAPGSRSPRRSRRHTRAARRSRTSARRSRCRRR